MLPVVFQISILIFDSILIFLLFLECDRQGQTDLAWFRDNMLCLVSNAVKFSLDKSDIIVRIRRVSTSAPASSSSVTASTTGELRKSVKRRADADAAGEQQQLQFVQFSVQDSGPGLTEEEKIRYCD